MSYAETLPERLEDAMLESAPGTVISHPREGGTRAAVPITTDSIRHAVVRAVDVMDALDSLTRADPVWVPAPAVSVEVNVLDD